MASHSTLRRHWDRLVLYRVQAGLVWLFIALARLLSPAAASDLGGAMLRHIGPHLARTRRMRRNIARTLPHLCAAEVERIIRQSWDNLGRTYAEYAHLDRISADFDACVTLIGAEHLTALVDDGRPGIVFTGHFANWELCAISAARLGLPLTYVFRRPNNPYVATMLAKARAALGGTMLPKGREAAKGLVAAIRAGRHVGLLVDQKLNEGLALPFLGRDAMTGTLLADIALRHDAPVVPLLVTRTGAARFKVQAFPPLDFIRSGDAKADQAAAMTQVNDLLAQWVRDDPGQWMWQHRRWPD